jgi:hypothetical protein
MNSVEWKVAQQITPTDGLQSPLTSSVPESLRAREQSARTDGPAGPKPVGSSGHTPKEEMMPHVIVKLYPGRSDEQETRLAEEIVKDVVTGKSARCPAFLLQGRGGKPTL